MQMASEWHRNGTDVALQVSARMAKFAPQKRASLALLTKNIPFKQKISPLWHDFHERFLFLQSR